MPLSKLTLRSPTEAFSEGGQKNAIFRINMTKLLIATRNIHKIPTITKELLGVSFEIVGLDSVGSLPSNYEVNEQAMTFEGNAITKAIIFGNKTGLLTLADDSGLCVDALDGRPGVLSARYAQGSAKDRYMKLLDELKDVPKEKRTAQYIAVIAIYDPRSETVNTYEGLCEGLIMTKPIGKNGFGYDPVFFSTDLKKVFAQASAEEKDSVSHRGRAMRKAKDYLLKFPCGTLFD